MEKIRKVVPVNVNFQAINQADYDCLEMELTEIQLEKEWNKRLVAKTVKPVKATGKKVKGNKITKNEIFLSIVRQNPGITMTAATKTFAEKTGSIDKHYNLVNRLVAEKVLTKGPVKFGKGDYGIYFA